ncbi:PAS domain-containing protein, partial [Guyparkeria sp. 1SP6A2]|nr:PAS domain-containing protein [Guyparkeria sp. 1SP6A2]
FEEELLNYRKDGTPYWVHISCNPLPANEQTGGGFIAIQSDITDTKLHEEAPPLVHHASHIAHRQDEVVLRPAKAGLRHGHHIRQRHHQHAL